ncbi:DUF421 domain-containing protein [Sedimentibacter sp. MB31-C6]|uniref:DUF421 domain-containing protein n=1 Tax=Sedimentibacter sp. MB31-C6 TaxID=3109366 RepID=UPI002DDCB14B|nr:DUF421 domain-containing protein [Sedimentibacter sp. MB36-C1]WSI05202.1 DUF421 domain-containing protein [Sedimentibacter sp. MB36-C1]
MSWIEITLRTLVSYLVLIIMTRVMGKKQLSHLTFFNYVTGITIGSMAASLVTDSNLQILQGTYSIILWSVLTVLLEYITLKSIKLRELTDGRPTILIKQGKLIEDALVKTRYNIDELNMMLRKSNIFNIEEVDYAILENSGELNILKKVEYQNYIKKDSNNSIKANKNITTQVISKGKMNTKTLDEFNLDVKWLENEIKKKGYKNLKDITYAEIDSNGSLFIMPVDKSKIKKEQN